MTTDGYVDGNAMGGALMEMFGREMTDVLGRCAECGEINRLGALIVYDRAPGQVARCPGCDAVILVTVERQTGLRFHFAALRWVESAR
jgi:hypothetical protein